MASVTHGGKWCELSQTGAESRRLQPRPQGKLDADPDVRQVAWKRQRRNILVQRVSLASQEKEKLRKAGSRSGRRGQSDYAVAAGLNLSWRGEASLQPCLQSRRICTTMMRSDG